MVAEIGIGKERVVVPNNDEGSSSIGVYICRVGERILERDEWLMVLTSPRKTHVESTSRLSGKARLVHAETIKDPVDPEPRLRWNLESVIQNFLKKPQTVLPVASWRDLTNSENVAVFTLNDGSKMVVRHVDSILAPISSEFRRPHSRSLPM